MPENSLFLGFGNQTQKIIDNDFPSKARTALFYLIIDLENKNFLVNNSEVLLELNRIGRFTSSDLDTENIKGFGNQVSHRIHKLSWYQLYYFCERIYLKLLREVGICFEDGFISISDVRDYFSNEMNAIMDEEGIAFQFVEGKFHRRGKAQTQKALQKIGQVLSNPRLDRVRNHFIKGRIFFDKRPDMDCENCVKEAFCALEAAIEILTGKNASREFDKSIRQLLGNKTNQIPIPIGESMIKVHAYRGSGQGVAHAATLGNRVEPVDAELILSLVASFITYLVDLFPFDDDVPF